MFEEYRNRMARNGGSYMGETMRKQSEFITDKLWMNSVSTYPVCVHYLSGGLPPTYNTVDDYQKTLYSHFETKSVYNAGGEEPAYYLTFKPSDMREYADIRVGAYVSIPDMHGNLEYWLIIHIDDDNELQKCQILKCNHIIRWVHNGSIYSCLGVLREGSDTKGIELGGQLSQVDSDIYLWVPTNVEVNTISYDTRFLISNVGRIPPLAWKVTSVKDMGPIGLTRLCLSQDPFNDSTDSAELMIADYLETEIKPTEPESKPEESVGTVTISYNGTKPTIRVGSQKVFTVNLPDDNHFDVKWTIFDGANTYGSEYDNTSTVYGDYTMITTDRTLTLKVAQNYDLVGTIITIAAECADGSVGEISVEVIS